MRKALILTTTVLGALFLVVLGMRNPYCSKEQRPKQRPRAVIVTEKKISHLVDSQLQELTAAATICTPIPLLAAAPGADTPCNTQYLSLPSIGFSAVPPSRASPRYAASTT